MAHYILSRLYHDEQGVLGLETYVDQFIQKKKKLFQSYYRLLSDSSLNDAVCTSFTIKLLLPFAVTEKAIPKY